MPGTPLRMHFDSTNNAFEFTYRPDRRIKAPTEIFVSPPDYPRGYVVRVDHGRVGKRTKRMLYVEANGAKVVRVRVVPRER